MRLPLYTEPRVSALNTEPPASHDPACKLCSRNNGNVRSVCMKPEVSSLGDGPTVLLVGEAPGAGEDGAGRPWVGATGKFLRDILQKHWKGRVVFDNAVRCAGDPLTPKNGPKPTEACRPYLARTAALVQPERIIAMGRWAMASVLGRALPPLSVLSGYGWHIDEERYVEQGLSEEASAVPVYLTMNPTAAVRNRFLRRDFEQDLAYALTREKPIYKHQRLSNTLRVSNEGEAIDAYGMCSNAGAASLDIEASGKMWDADYRVNTLTFWPLHIEEQSSGFPLVVGIPNGGFTFTREALSDPRILGWVRQLLANPDVAKVGANTKYDCSGLYADKALRMRVQGKVYDIRLLRKLLAPGVDGDLETMAELIGMGGHKGEAQTALKAICTDLTSLAGEDARKPLASGKPRAPVRTKYVRREDVDPLHIELLRKWKGSKAFTPKTFAFRYMRPDTRDTYNALDACSTGHVFRLEAAQMQESPNLIHVHEKIVRPASWALTRLEEWGIAADRGALELFDQHLDAEEELARSKLRPYGEDVNWDSNPQIAEVLYGRLGLPMLSKTAGGAASTDEAALERLADRHPLPKAIRALRHVNTMRKYARGMLPHIREDERIHTSYLLDGTECMPAGELVLTARGYLPVEEVKVGDIVLTHKGRGRKVIRTVKNSPEPIYGVSLANGTRLRVNAKHPFRVGDEWVEAQHLVQGTPVSVHSDEERWALIPGWRGYEVSTWGRVRNVHSQKLLAQQPKGRWGHLKVSLKRNGARERGADFRDFAVHRLVLLAHCGPDAGEVRHLNGIAWDNTLANLVYGTRKENALDAVGHGTMSHRGAHNGQRKLTEAAVQEIRTRAVFVSHAKLAREFNVSRELVRDVCAGKRWQEKVYDEPRASFGVSTVLYASRTGISEATYGLTVEEDHSHVTGGIVTHNTGRPSGKDPNLLNIPRAKGSKEGRMARNAFIAPRKRTKRGGRRVLVEGDMSQQELRVAAMLSGDQRMIDLFNSGADFHATTFGLVHEIAFGVKRAEYEDLLAAYERVKWAAKHGAAPDPADKAKHDRFDEYRSKTKGVVFGDMYGKIAQTYAKEYGIPVPQAERMVQAITGQFTRFQAWKREQLSFGRLHGGVFTSWAGQTGRWRPLYAIADQGDTNAGRRINAENSTCNTPIQGTAAEYVTASLAPIIELYEDEGLDAMLVLTVYDSILTECDEEDVETVVRIKSHVMTSHDSGPVRLKADFKVGTSWGEMRDYELAS